MVGQRFTLSDYQNQASEEEKKGRVTLTVLSVITGSILVALLVALMLGVPIILHESTGDVALSAAHVAAENAKSLLCWLNEHQLVLDNLRSLVNQSCKGEAKYQCLLLMNGALALWDPPEFLAGRFVDEDVVVMERQGQTSIFTTEQGLNTSKSFKCSDISATGCSEADALYPELFDSLNDLPVSDATSKFLFNSRLERWEYWKFFVQPIDGGFWVLSLPLHGISEVLRSNPLLGEGNVIAVADSSGFMLASSAEDTIVLVDGQPGLRNAAEASHFSTRQSAAALFPVEVPIKKMNISWGVGTTTSQVAVAPLVSEFNPPWLIMVDIDQGLGTAFNAIPAFLLTIGGILILAIVGGLISFHWHIIKPVRKFAMDLRDMANLDDSHHHDDSKEVRYAVAEMQDTYSTIRRVGTGFDSFIKFVPLELMKGVMRRNCVVKPEMLQERITVLFMDVCNFTTITEKCPERAAALVLMELFDAMTTIIVENHGTVDKYIGDCIMAIWNAPLAVPDHCQRACKAALECQVKLRSLQRKWAKRGLPLLSIRFGINVGKMLVGTIGSKNRLNYTVIGDAVNVASRLESLNKSVDSHGILISGPVKGDLNDDFVARSLGETFVKGKDKKIDIYSLDGMVGLEDEETTVQLPSNDVERRIRTGSLFMTLPAESSAAGVGKGSNPSTHGDLCRRATKNAMKRASGATTSPEKDMPLGTMTSKSPDEPSPPKVSNPVITPKAVDVNANVDAGAPAKGMTLPSVDVSTAPPDTDEDGEPATPISKPESKAANDVPASMPAAESTGATPSKSKCESIKQEASDAPSPGLSKTSAELEKTSEPHGEDIVEMERRAFNVIHGLIGDPGPDVKEEEPPRTQI